MQAKMSMINSESLESAKNKLSYMADPFSEFENLSGTRGIKILFFIDALNAGGKERRLVELIKELRHYPGIRPELVVMNKEIHFSEIHELGIKIHFVIRNSKKDISVFRRVYKLCKLIRPDCVHCWDSMTSIYVIPAIKLLKIKYVNGMIVDAPQKQNIFNKNWLRARIAFPFSNLVIGNSMAGLRAYKAPSKKSVCIHNGFNFSRVLAIKRAEEIRKELRISSRFIIGMVASYSKFKDYKTFFLAAMMLLDKRDDVTFLAIGEGTDSADSRNQIEKKYSEKIKLLGKKTSVESYINAMDICVLSTFTEGISNSIMEYMSLSKPVIATEGGGTMEIVENGKTGYLIPPGKPEILCQKMEELLINSELAREMGKSGKKLIEEKFSINSMVHQYVLNYNKLF